MSKKDSTPSKVKRLQLRREVIRVLAADSLAQVRGGWGGGDDSCESLCAPSKGGD